MRELERRHQENSLSDSVINKQLTPVLSNKAKSTKKSRPIALKGKVYTSVRDSRDTFSRGPGPRQPVFSRTPDPGGESRANQASRRASRARRAAAWAHRGRLLKMDLDATAGGVFDGLLGLVVEMVVLQAATGRPQGSDVGAGACATRLPKGRRGLGAHAAHEEGSSA